MSNKIEETESDTSFSIVTYPTKFILIPIN